MSELRKERKTKNIIFCVTETQKKKFHAWCVREGVTMSEAVREFMEGKK